MRRAAVLAALVLGACQPRTEIVIGIITDIRAPDLIDSVKLDVTRTRDGFPEEQLPPWTITGIPNQPFNLPGSYGVYSPDGSEVKVLLEVTGLKKDMPVLTRHAIVSLVPGKTLFLRMGLAGGCVTVKDCGATQTCVEGRCKERVVDMRTLPDYLERLVFELTCDSGIPYLDTATGNPMPFSADAMNCPAALCQEGTCLNPADDAGVQQDLSASDSMSVDDGSTASLKGCPGDVLGTPQLMATGSFIGGVFVDPATGSLVWTDPMTLSILMSDPCTAAPQAISTGENVSAGVILNGLLFYTAGGSLKKIAIAPNSTAAVITDSPTVQYMTTDGTDLFWLSGNNILRFMTGGSVPMPLQFAVNPQSPLLALGGGSVFWLDTMPTGDMTALGVTGAQVVGGSPALVSPVTMSVGLFADASNVYWTDSGQGLMMRPLSGMAAQQIAPPGTMLDTGGRLTGDGTNLYFTSIKGTNDRILQALPQPAATVQTLATGQSVDGSATFPKLAVGPHGVYWVDTTQHIWRTAALP